ncbi:MAG TPA: hypothetical protein VNV86_08805 [Candidatus Acidoferrum sp.]|nr:hypothetical protein [Candidatus Acidoferrum sp.]
MMVIAAPRRRDGSRREKGIRLADLFLTSLLIGSFIGPPVERSFKIGCQRLGRNGHVVAANIAVDFARVTQRVYFRCADVAAVIGVIGLRIAGLPVNAPDRLGLGRFAQSKANLRSSSRLMTLAQ